MRNLRYANAERTIIQAEDDAGNTLNIPADPGNRHFAELSAKLSKGEAVIADFTPDPRAAEGEKLARLQKRFWAELAAGEKPIEDVVAEARAVASSSGEALADKAQRP